MSTTEVNGPAKTEDMGPAKTDHTGPKILAAKRRSLGHRIGFRDKQNGGHWANNLALSLS